MSFDYSLKIDPRQRSLRKNGSYINKLLGGDFIITSEELHRPGRLNQEENRGGSLGGLQAIWHPFDNPPLPAKIQHELFVGGVK